MATVRDRLEWVIKELNLEAQAAGLSMPGAVALAEREFFAASGTGAIARALRVCARPGGPG